MTINDYLDMEALDNILEQWAAATHMIAVVLDDEGNFLSNKLGFSRNNVEAFGESIEVDDVEVATVVGGPLMRIQTKKLSKLLLPFWLPLSRIS